MPVRRTSFLWRIAGPALLIVFTVAAYWSALHGFFLGDDFIHLRWLHELQDDFSPVWQNFWSPWMSDPSVKFYRPLISLSLVFDHLVWGWDAFGYHLTNVVLHLVTCFFIYGIVVEMGSVLVAEGRRFSHTWASVAAVLFALHPLHPEAVSWIIGRVDVVVVTFIVASLYFYMRWRRQQGVLNGLAAALFLALGLMSKEMALAVPLMFVTYDLAVWLSGGLGVITARESPGNLPESEGAGQKGPRAEGNLCVGEPLNAVTRRLANAQLASVCVSMEVSPQAPDGRQSGVIRAACASWPFWLLLVGYFVLRRVALGTWLGGYEDSFVPWQDFSQFKRMVLSGLYMLVIPLNKSVVTPDDWRALGWYVGLGAAGVSMLLVACRLKGRILLPVGLLVTWLFLSLLPVYQVFHIAENLMGARFAYLATVPLCMILALSFAGSRRWLSFQGIGCAVLVGFSFVNLLANNEPWGRASNEMRAFRAALNSYIAGVPGDPFIVIYGIRDNVDGALLIRNAFTGLIKRPMLDRDLSSCRSIQPETLFEPLGYWKKSMNETAAGIHFLRWEPEERKLLPLAMRQAEVSRNELPINHELATGIALSPSDSGMRVTTKHGMILLPFDVNIDGWQADFIELSLAGRVEGADSSVLVFTTDRQPWPLLYRSVPARVFPREDSTILLFPLRSMPDIAFGGKLRAISIAVPGSALEFTHCRHKAAAEVIPEFRISARYGSHGFCIMADEQNEVEVIVDASHLPGATIGQLEWTESNGMFVQPYGTGGYERGGSKRCPLVGTVTLRKDDFPRSGAYQVRFHALDDQLRPVAPSSDHIVVTVGN